MGYLISVANLGYRVLRSSACAAIVGTAILADFGSAQTSPSLTPKAIQTIDSMVAQEFAKDSIGSITVGLITGSQLAWTKSYGFRDMKSKRLADRNTVYRIGSITKPFTAVMLMQLVNAGKVKLSDPVERFLPEVQKLRGRPAHAAPFTFLQLATMTAGIAREPAEEGPFWTGPVSQWEKTMISAIPHTNYLSVPGTEFSYSNIGYAMLGAALGRVAGIPYTEWERTRIFTPLGMTRTRFEVDSSIQRDVAVGYEVQGNGTPDDKNATQELKNGRGYKVPNGAIFTTVDDLARFVSFELGRGPASVLPPSVLDDAFGGIVAADRGFNSGYGLGFMSMRRGDFTYSGHNGGVAGYVASMYFDRAYQLGVVLFRNVAGGRQNPDRLTVDILESLVTARRSTIQADIDRRLKEKVPHPTSEAAIRRIIDELRRGTPNYALMQGDFARQLRQRMADEQANMTRLGALQSVTFKAVGPAGPDIYTVKFEKGWEEWRIWLNPEGNVDFFNHREVPAPPGG